MAKEVWAYPPKIEQLRYHTTVRIKLKQISKRSDDQHGVGTYTR